MKSNKERERKERTGDEKHHREIENTATDEAREYESNSGR